MGYFFLTSNSPLCKTLLQSLSLECSFMHCVHDFVLAGVRSEPKLHYVSYSAMCTAEHTTQIIS